jgi:thiosulfate/3-mercaptopyruvate sulfurtransferase
MKDGELIGRRIALMTLVVVMAGVLFQGLKQVPAQSFPDTWTPAQVMTPEELVQELAGPARPTVIAVTFKQLYDRAHVPAALYFGPGQNPVTLAKLKQWAETQPKDEEIVLYCGCCPWRDCPNIHPPFSLLKDLGFTRLRVVRIDSDFTRGWIYKKYPVEASK